MLCGHRYALYKLNLVRLNLQFKTFSQRLLWAQKNYYQHFRKNSHKFPQILRKERMFPILFNKVGKIKLPSKEKYRPISLMKIDTKINDKILSKRINAKKQRKTIEWERLQISSRKVEIPREYFMQSEVAQSCPTLATPWTAAHQHPLSVGFSRQECWSGVPSPS